jgi:hypothetical protein
MDVPRRLRRAPWVEGGTLPCFECHVARQGKVRIERQPRFGAPLLLRALLLFLLCRLFFLHGFGWLFLIALL